MFSGSVSVLPYCRQDGIRSLHYRIVQAFLLCLLALLAMLYTSAPALAQRNLTLQPTAEQGGKRVALIIGNAAYQNISKLTNPVNDADDIARALRGFGFDVLLHKNLDRRAMKEAVAEFGRRAGNAEAALFYYAGHGVQIKGQNYLMPVNASAQNEADVADEGININYALETMEGANSRVNIVMLDACRDNPISGKFRTVGGTRGLAPPASTPRGTVLVYATDPGNTAADGNGRNGLFTAGLLQAFKGKDLSLDGVLTQASEVVEKQSGGKQIPYVNGPKTTQKNFHFSVTVNPGPGELERDFWASIRDSRDPADFEAYLRKYPKGEFRELAENRLRALRQPQQAMPAQRPSQFVSQPAPQPAQPTTSGGSRPADTLTFALNPTGNRPGANAPAGGNPPGNTFQPATGSTGGNAFRDCPVCPEMVALPRGSFTMGTYKGDADEKPPHEVKVTRSIAIGKYEVTFDEWDACANEGACARKPGDEGWGRGRQPVINVSWEEAQQYVKWLSGKSGRVYRLPTEAEWEYAAQGGRADRWFFGNDEKQLVQYAWYGENAGKRTRPVGQRQPNAFGLHDMLGNVWEWVQDCHKDNYEGAPTDAATAVEDSKCTHRATRGGGWNNFFSNDLRTHNRYYVIPNRSFNYLGFRVARFM